MQRLQNLIQRIESYFHPYENLNLSLCLFCYSSVNSLTPEHLHIQTFHTTIECVKIMHTFHTGKPVSKIREYLW
jgi:hypothetical protein